MNHRASGEEYDCVLLRFYHIGNREGVGWESDQAGSAGVERIWTIARIGYVFELVITVWNDAIRLDESGQNPFFNNADCAAG